MVRKYANPPIEQVSAELRFKRADRWDLTIPGLVYQELDGKEKFPHREQERVLVKSSITVSPSSLQHSSELVDRVKFLTQDRKTVVQLGSDILSVHKLRPYESWQSFLPVVREAVGVYLRVAEPESLVMLSLQYTNKFDIPCDVGEMNQYLNLSPQVGPSLKKSEQFNTFITGICSPHESGRDTLRIELITTGQGESEVLHLGLLSRYVLERPSALSLDSAEIMKWLETAHGHANDAFEFCITDKTRALFGEASQ